MLGWVAERHPSLLRQLVAEGHELGSHSHIHRMVHQQAPDAFRTDLRRSIGAIEDATGVRVSCYRAPGFSITPAQAWAFAILVEEGIETDSSVYRGIRAHGGFRAYKEEAPHFILTQSGPLKEFPISTVGLGPFRMAFAGGGYFRMLPRFALLWGCRKQDYLMSYFHPRDFDPEQPKLEGLSFHRRFRAYVGLEGSASKLEALLAIRPFISLREASLAEDWSAAACVDLRPDS